MSQYRAVRPPNKSPRDFGLDWGVKDNRDGADVSEYVYAEAFARKLAAAMNYAFEQGRRSLRR